MLSCVLWAASGGLAYGQSSPNSAYDLYSSTSTPSYYRKALSRAFGFGKAGNALLPTTAAGHASGQQSAAPSSPSRPATGDPSFVLRATYAFPDPARDKVTIRVQPGLADEIKVAIFNGRGRQVYSSSNFANRGVFDDGNGLGPQYTYDLVWDVTGMGRGVYIYVLTVRKAGQADLHKTSKFAVVR